MHGTMNLKLTNTDFGKYNVQAFLRFHIVSHCFKVNGTSHLINSFILIDHIDLVLVQCLLCRKSCAKVTLLQIIQLHLSKI
jgi:hypothetical protein